MPVREFGVAVLVRHRKSEPEMLLVRGSPDGMLGGLWHLPAATLDGEAPEAAAMRAADSIRVARGGRGLPLPTRVQVYSHFRGIYHPFLWTGADGSAPPGTVWAGPEALDQFALSAANRVITRAAMAAADHCTPSTDTRNVARTAK